MTLPRKFPSLRDAQVAVLAVEGLTGIVLSLDGNRAIADEERYRVCNSIEEARMLIKRLVLEHPLWECVIYDQHANRIEVYRNDEALMYAAQSSHRQSWWSRLLKLVGRKEVL